MHIKQLEKATGIEPSIYRRIIFVGMISIFLLSQITAMKLVNAETELPKAAELRYINDYTKVIDSKSAEYILSIGKDLEAKTGVQATVVVIDSLLGETMESYATGIFRSSGIGQNDINNGLLIILSMEEKKWKVEVGTGLEGTVTDIYASSVMNDFAVPKFKENQYGEGLRAAYSALADSIAKEYNVTLDKNVNVLQYAKKLIVSKGGSDLGLIGFIVLAFLSIIFNRGNGGSFGGDSGGGDCGDDSGNDSGGFGGGSSSGGGSSGEW